MKNMKVAEDQRLIPALPFMFFMVKSSAFPRITPSPPRAAAEFSIAPGETCATITLPFASWCNGSTADSGSVCHGSNPCEAAIVNQRLTTSVSRSVPL
jgi:hypothetical protein